MAYLKRKNPFRMMATINSPSPMAGVIDDIGGFVNALSGNNNAMQIAQQVAAATTDQTVKACIKAANANGVISALDQSILDIAKNWQPSGFYTPDQITQVVGMVVANLQAPLVSVQSAVQSSADASDVIAGAVNRINQLLGSDPTFTGDSANTFISGAATAKATGATVVNAPGLKDWVIHTLQAGSNALVVQSVMACNQTWLEQVVGSVTAAIRALGSFLYTIGSMVVGAAETVFKIPETIGTLWSVLKYGAIAGGAYYIWHEWLKHKIKAR